MGPKAKIDPSVIQMLFAALFLLVFLAPKAEALSIGISPGRVEFEGVLKEGYAERSVLISTNSEETLIGHFTAGGDIKDWLSFEPNTTQIVITQDAPYRLTIRIEPPSDIPTGNYSGNIEFVTDSVGGVEGRAGGVVKAAVTLLISSEVTGDQQIECRAGGFEVKNIEQGFPLEVGINVINDGNVRLSPTVLVDVWDQLQEKLLFSREVKARTILPTTQQRVSVQIDNSLPEGQYWSTIRAEECNSEEIMTFSVVEKGGIIDSGTLIGLTSKPWISLGETVEILAQFANTGSRSVDAQFKGTIRKDDSIVKIVESETLLVPAGQTIDFPLLFTPYEEGRYVLTGRVIYNKKLTYEKSAIINVNPPNEEEAQSSWIPLILYLAILLTFAFLLRKIIKERRKRKGFE